MVEIGGPTKTRRYVTTGPLRKRDGSLPAPCLLLGVLVLTVGCSRFNRSRPGSAASAWAGKVVNTTAGAFVPPISPSAFPVRESFRGTGIEVSELANGKVIVKSTTVWNQPIDLLYENCDFYLKAIPTISHQVDPACAQTLASACGHEK